MSIYQLAKTVEELIEHNKARKDCYPYEPVHIDILKELYEELVRVEDLLK